MSDTLNRDLQFVWHPFTQHGTERDPVVITRAENASLFDDGDNEILDLISSWWTCLHGHAHPEINEALIAQAQKMEHVMFSNFTHPPAVDLAEALADLLPGDLSRVFFSDNGSTSVEVALKMAFQYWRNRGESARTVFLALDGGYHGDTLGAMSVGRGSGFFNIFEDMMCEVRIVPFADTWHGDHEIEKREENALAALKQALHDNRDKIAAIIMEPLMQGAAGMRFARPSFVRSVTDLVRQEGGLIIFDEVATGFGRTGTMLATEQAGAVPDIICLSKGLTAGYMPLSVTVATESLFQAFLGEDFSLALLHGHSFTANPLACAVALRSLKLFEEEDTFRKIEYINNRHRALLNDLLTMPMIEKPRVLGTVLACNLVTQSKEYKSAESLFLRDWYLDHGLNIRPIGPAIYLMPPYCITDDELDRGYSGLMEGLAALKAAKPS